MILKTKLSIFLFVGILLNSNIVLSQQIITPEIITESETSESSTEETKIVTIEQQREEVHQVEIVKDLVIHK